MPLPRASATGRSQQVDGSGTVAYLASASGGSSPHTLPGPHLVGLAGAKGALLAVVLHVAAVELHQLHRVLADVGRLGHQLLRGQGGRWVVLRRACCAARQHGESRAASAASVAGSVRPADGGPGPARPAAPNPGRQHSPERQPAPIWPLLPTTACGGGGAAATDAASRCGDTRPNHPALKLTCMSGCLRKSLPSLISSTFDRLGLLLVGGRLGVATHTVCRLPRCCTPLPEAWRGAREAPRKDEAGMFASWCSGERAGALRPA